MPLDEDLKIIIDSLSWFASSQVKILAGNWEVIDIGYKGPVLLYIIKNVIIQQKLSARYPFVPNSGSIRAWQHMTP